MILEPRSILIAILICICASDKSAGQDKKEFALGKPSVKTTRRMLEMPLVQRALGMSEKQLELIEARRQNYFNQRKLLTDKINEALGAGTLSKEEKKSLHSAWQRSLVKAHQESNVLESKILTPKQTSRFFQIFRQMRLAQVDGPRGYHFLLNKEIVEILKIRSTEQLAFTEKQDRTLESIQKALEEYRARVKKIVLKHESDFKSQLSDKQKKTFEDVFGERFGHNSGREFK